jgi:hypothetical protein
MGQLNQDQIEAAQEFVDATINALRNDKGVHAETAISATARMAGTFLFRSFGFELDGLKPGQAVFSEAANERGPRLVDILGSILSSQGIALDQKKFTEPTPADNEPHLGFLDTQRKLEPSFSAIKDQRGLTLQQAAESAAAATAILIQQCASVLEPNIAFGIALHGFIEGSKTAPDPVALTA